MSQAKKYGTTGSGNQGSIQSLLGHRLRQAGLACALAGALFMTGCAGSQPAPTHHWVSFDQVTGVAYLVDNNQCARETLGEASPRVLKTNTEEYDKYVSCMNDKGYVLTAYNSEE
jgi:hypothetical protein